MSFPETNLKLMFTLNEKVKFLALFNFEDENASLKFRMKTSMFFSLQS